MGSGPRRVVVLNDWLCDTSTWDGARPYLDEARFTWAFTDLRGYGRSRGQTGEFTAVEAAGDVLELAAALAWPRFAVVGHSMSSYVAMHLAQHAVDRIERIVLVTPAPPRGFGADAAWLASSQESTRDDARRADMVKARFAERLSPGWATYKSRRWLATSDAEAAASYIAMFARDGLPTPTAPIAVPVLAITGEQDAPLMRAEPTRQHLTPLCAQLEIAALAESGHYPMQEMPPLTVALVERFLGA
ncbi:MAG: alpha/beta hydrolase [Kofleriaceae bacterium]